MTRIRLTILIVILCMAAADAQAQRRRNKKKAPVRQEVVEEPAKTPGQLLYENMLPSTARILVFDSVTTRRDRLMEHIPLNKECGRLTNTDITGALGQADSLYTYINEFGNKCFMSRTGSDGKTHLYTSDRLGDGWSKPQLIKELDEGFEDIRNPFMMPDGITLYFAAKGENSIGGYDIFVTMYDTEEAKFYRPENIGLPFNSFDDDLFYIVSEADSLGWLVSNRRQAGDTLCVYSFVPQKSRETYSIDATPAERLNALAEMSSIKDTWTDKHAVNDARKRLAAAQVSANKTKDNGKNISFVINDDITYTSASQFRSATAKRLYAELCDMQQRLETDVKAIELARDNYIHMKGVERTDTAKEIGALEKKIIELRSEINGTMKRIRNAENIELNH